MSDIAVSCGCGRTMTPDALAGRGAYRCGCGARVKVTVSRTAECTGLAEDAEACRAAPVREAAKEGLSLCAGHLGRYRELITESARAAERVQWLAAVDREEGEALRALDDELRERYQAQSVVYYVRMRDLVKIGTTVNMTARGSKLMWDEVLATEPGGYDLEQMRHKQFRHLKVRGERFEAAPDLMSHIAMIRGHFGEPQITGYLQAAEAVTPAWLMIREAAERRRRGS